MKKFLPFLFLSCSFLVQAETVTPGEAEVRTLGTLNGEALACSQMALVDRIRIAIVHEAPKTREIGEIFENATSTRFLAMGQEKVACRDARALSAAIETEISRMRTAFTEVMGRKP